MLRVAVRMVLIFILAYAGVKIWYNRLENAMLSSLPAEKVVQAEPEEKKVEIRRKSDDYRIIIDRNIFGAALEKNAEVEVAQPVEDLQPTTLKLSLMGTVFGDQKDSRAIIEDLTNRKQDIYAVGNIIQGAQIKAIERRRVILRVNGRDEVLNIKEREGGGPDSRISSAQESASPEPVVRRSLRDRLTVRRPAMRPSLPNRPRPGITSPSGREVTENDSEDIAGENNNEIPDQDTEQLEEPDTTDEELLDEPDFMDDEPIDEPELKDEERY